MVAGLAAITTALHTAPSAYDQSGAGLSTAGPHWNRLLDVPADGGQPRVLFELSYQPGGGNLVYMWGPVCRDPDGEWLLAFAAISSGAVIRLPFPEGQPYDAAW